MSARERILGRIRRVTTGADPQAVAARLAAGQSAPIPAQGQSLGAAMRAQFIAKARGVQASVSEIARFEDLPAALALELRARNLPARIRSGADPVFARDWGGIEHSVGVGRLVEPATLSRAEFGVAETGTLVLASGRLNPVTLTFLGETHFVVVPAADLMPGFEPMWAAWRTRSLDPRTVNLVTGPSRSADIGQVLQLGAHGPVALHVFVVG